MHPLTHLTTSLLPFSIFILSATAHQKVLSEEGSRKPLNAEFDDLVYRTLDKWHVPGLAIAVVDGNNTYSK
ncbi:MAG: hypothetical protein M1835_004177, partial [Candelina submexicana]